MQLETSKNTYGKILLLVFIFSCMTPTKARAISIKQVVGATLFTTAIATYVRLLTKKTQPTRRYPADDSLQEQLWFWFDEILAGQKEKDKKAVKLIVNPENPEEALIVYEGVEARGVAGTIHSYIKPVIIPVVTLIVLFNKELKKKILEGIVESREFINNPGGFISEISTALTADLSEAHRLVEPSKK